MLPKCDSLTDAFESLDLDFACISETWFKGGKDLRAKLTDIEGASGIRIVHKSRDGRLGQRGGGVAIAFNTSTCNFKQRTLRITDKGHEIVCVTGRVAKIERKFAIFTVYIPPQSRVGVMDDLVDSLLNEIAHIKTSSADPIIVVAGDFNRRDISGPLRDAAGLHEVATAPTRGTNKLDVVFSNLGADVNDTSVLPPLQAVSGAESDHKCVYIQAQLPAVKNFKWEVKLRRERNLDRELAFARDLEAWESSCLDDLDVDGMAETLERKIGELTELHFPLRRLRRRSNEDPWITRRIRRLWKRKLRLYRRNGRCQRWWATDLELQLSIEEAKEAFVGRLLADGNGGRSFYAAARKLSSAASRPDWKVTDLFPGADHAEVGKQVLDYFGKISCSSTPRPEAGDRLPGGLAHFTKERTVELLRSAKKTDSRVEGDPLAHLVRKYPESFAGPISKIYNQINDCGRWPKRWKTEHLTIIPKVPNPANLSECRNISCTSIFSKVLENQVLGQLRKELTPDPRQYGGVPNCGVEFMLVDMWEGILEGLEGGSSAAILLGVDYEKAFNRMEHAVCLQQLNKLGASQGSISLVRAFLEDRVMTITIDGVRAPSVPILRGSPQGSVLGCLLYCVTTQNLTSPDNLAGGERPRYFPQDSSDDEGVDFWSDMARPAARPPEAFLYVDDTTLFQTVPLASATRHFTEATTIEELENLELERTLKNLEKRATDTGMKINGKKTQLLVISPRNGCVTSAAIQVSNEAAIRSQETMKLVGFTFGEEPNAGRHVDAVVESYRKGVWMLHHLKRAGFRDGNLYRLYCCYLRSRIEYCSAVYHSLLSKGEEEALEKLHRNAIRICYGFDARIETTMAANHIESLKERRIRRCDAFIRKAVENRRFQGRWFPRREQAGHWIRNRRIIAETRASTQRRFNSPLAFMRRRANDLGLAIEP